MGRLLGVRAVLFSLEESRYAFFYECVQGFRRQRLAVLGTPARFVQRPFHCCGTIVGAHVATLSSCPVYWAPLLVTRPAF